MKSEQLLDALAIVGDDLVEAAAKETKIHLWAQNWYARAASILLTVLALGILYQMLFGTPSVESVRKDWERLEKKVQQTTITHGEDIYTAGELYDSVFSSIAKGDRAGEYNSFFIIVSADEAEENSGNLMEDYADLFYKISRGRKNDAPKYVELIYEISHGAIEVDESEVLDLAAEIAESFDAVMNKTYSQGVKDIRIEEKLFGQELVISYTGISAYHIERLAENDPVYKGEKTLDPDFLVDYRYAIYLTDLPDRYGSAWSEEMAVKYAGDNTLLLDVPKELEGKINVKLAGIPDDASFCLYIGSDEPLVIEEEGGKLDDLGANNKELRIPIKFEK